MNLESFDFRLLEAPKLGFIFLFPKLETVRFKGAILRIPGRDTKGKLGFFKHGEMGLR